ncbi:hypothetical protein H5410_036189 [Solanum commersonii]|uniref:Uncharacterized protein n=1 Tax=Solanum commersonii TaxID=4109 RepID=A0A9J5Y428_SOLCO|nr:hypothetical protein H5410_036189 [Solanum commersonii]
MASPKVPVFQALKEKIKLAIERKLKDAEGQRKKAMELTKGRITECIGDLDLLRRMVLRNTFFCDYKYIFKFLVYRELRTEFEENISLASKISIFEKLEVVANATLPSCFWLARERGFKTKITNLMACRY